MTPAAATTRYASPNGNFQAANECTDASNSCDLQHAIDKAAPDDEVVVQPGDYLRATTVDIGKKLYVHGVAGQPRPRLLSSVGSGGTAVSALGGGAGGTTLRYLEIDSPSGSGVNLGSSVVEIVGQELVVHAKQTACFSSRAVKWLDTLCWSSGSGPAMSLTGFGGGAVSTFTLRNVTAVATASPATGLSVQPQGGSVCNSGCSAEVTAVNTIARGTQYDVQATADPSKPSTSTNVTLSYSSFDPGERQENGSNAHIIDGGSNQAAAPLFAGATDFHQTPGSPTIDAGQTDDASNGPLDFEGDPRTFNGVTDIGADEFVPAPSPGPTTPLFTAASLTNRVFAVNSRGRAETPVAARAKRGTTFRYALSEPARVVFTIRRALPGRRVGARCVTPRRSNRNRPRCTRYKLFGRFAQQAAAGAGTKRWSGKIGRRRLSVGRYRATLIATGAAGIRSLPRQLGFRVVRR